MPDHMTTADAKVELVARAIENNLSVIVYEDGGQGRFISQQYEAEIEIGGIHEAARAAITALEASPNSRTEAITRENRMLRRKLAELGCELIENVDEHIAMQAARPIDRQGEGVPASPSGCQPTASAAEEASSRSGIQRGRYRGQ